MAAVQALALVALTSVAIAYRDAISRLKPSLRDASTADILAACGGNLNSPAVRRQRHNHICAVLVDFLRKECGAARVHCNVPLLQVPFPPEIDMSGLRGKTRKPDVIVVSALGRVHVLEVTVAREHKVADRVAEKMSKYSDVAEWVGASLACVAFGELGSAHGATAVALDSILGDSVATRRANARDVDDLVEELQSLVAHYAVHGKPPVASSRSRR